MFRVSVAFFLVIICVVFGGIVEEAQLGNRNFDRPSRNLKSSNPEERGPYFEGDIKIPRKTRSGITNEFYRWDNGIIPFEISKTLNQNDTSMVHEAFIAFHQTTCLKFIPKRPQDVDFIYVDNEASGCWSYIGRIGGKQEVNLESPKCFHEIGTPIHEIAHAVGFYHEQNREDRDDFVTIIYENIQPGHEKNFEKLPPGKATDFNIGYDYASIMHYSPTAFSKDEEKLRTIEVRGGTSSLMGQRKGLSDLDAEKIKRMYEC